MKTAPQQTTYVAYYRVSTTKQGESGLGLEAQQATVQAYVQSVGGELVNSYTEIESGKKNDREELSRALAEVQQKGATLVIARLDRLSRNVAFISQLMESKVPFVCCDMPTANNLTIHIFAAMAQWQREYISTKTKEGLGALKRRGVKLGKVSNFSDDTRAMGRAAMQRKAANNNNKVKATGYIRLMHANNYTLQAICDALNKDGHTTSRGKLWTPTQVHRILNQK